MYIPLFQLLCFLGLNLKFVAFVQVRSFVKPRR